MVLLIQALAPLGIRLLPAAVGPSEISVAAGNHARHVVQQPGADLGSMWIRDFLRCFLSRKFREPLPWHFAGLAIAIAELCCTCAAGGGLATGCVPSVTSCGTEAVANLGSLSEGEAPAGLGGVFGCEVSDLLRVALGLAVPKEEDTSAAGRGSTPEAHPAWVQKLPLNRQAQARAALAQLLSAMHR